MKTTEEVMAWLRARKDEPFWFTWCGKDLLIGVQNDDGEIDVFKARVVKHESAVVSRRTGRAGKGEP